MIRSNRLLLSKMLSWQMSPLVLQKTKNQHHAGSLTQNDCHVLVAGAFQVDEVSYSLLLPGLIKQPGDYVVP